jgi:hypothetical protein
MILSEAALAAYDRVASGVAQVIAVVAKSGAAQIKKQAQSGIDRNGRRMVDYKPSYAKVKGGSVNLTGNARTRRGAKKKPMLDDIIFDAPAFSEFSRGDGRFRDAGTGRFTKAEGNITFGSEQNSRIAGAIIEGRAGRGSMAGPRDFFGLEPRWVQKNVDKAFGSMFSGATAGLRNQRLTIKGL